MEALTIHYHRFDGNYKEWTLWSWSDENGRDARNIHSESKDDFGLIFTLPLWKYHHINRIGLLPKMGDWEKKDNGDKYWTKDKGYEVYIIQDDATVYSERPCCDPRLSAAWCDAQNALTVHTCVPLHVDELPQHSFTVSVNGTPLTISSQKPAYTAEHCTRVVTLTLKEEIPYETIRQGDVTVALNDTQPVIACPRYVCDDAYFYTDKTLGTEIHDGSVTFRVWAPAAQSLQLILSESLPLPPKGSSGDTQHSMSYVGNGVWEFTYHTDIRGWFYRYDVQLVHRPHETISVYDPYGRAAVREERACIIVDPPSPAQPAPSFPLEDTVIYEIHVRDMTRDISSGCENKGTYLGLTEDATHMPEAPYVPTGLAHIKQLGVNTVQIMPLHMFDMGGTEKEHAWGYMTRHFNAPDPSYATNKNGATAVKECAAMVDSFHAHGIKVILDVVYNHTTESPDYAEHWNGLAPHYMYRLRPDDTYSNGSGCGNEFRAEAPMAQRFLIDSLKYWVQAYGIDGFRFDLMGLFTAETMDTIVAELRAIKNDVIIYGEPWVADGTPITPTTKGTQKNKGYACFNDEYRSALIGSVFDDTPGYIWDGRYAHNVEKGWKGSAAWFTAKPQESINLVECHDDRTLRDKCATLHVPHHMQESDILAMDRLAAFLIILGQGIPFIHSGQDFFRTKFGVHNSYDKGDEVNRIRWQWKEDHEMLFSFYLELIQLRKQHSIFRLTSSKEVERRIATKIENHALFASVLDCADIDDTWDCAIALANPTNEEWRYRVPKTSKQWHVYVRCAHASATPLEALSSTQRIIDVPAHSAVLIAAHTNE